MRIHTCLRFCLPFGVTAGLVALLASGHAETPQPPSDTGIVWVYHAALCAKPGPPVHAYDAPTLTIDPGLCASR